MNEKDFEDIGKRMRDLEADPPKEGWKKIAGAIPQQPVQRGAWWKKHGWKFSVLLIPILFYFWIDTDNPLASESVKNSVAIQQDSSTATISSSDREKSTRSTTDESNPISKSSSSAPNQSKEKNNSKIAASTTISRILPSNSNQTTNDSTATINVADEKSGNTSLTAEDSNQYSLTRNEQRNKTNSTINENKETKILHERITAHDSSELYIQKSNPLLQENEMKSDSSQLANEIKSDTVTRRDSVAVDSQPKEKEKSKQGWRYTASLMPQYVAQTVRPVENDEVFVTNIEKPAAPQQIGASLAIGAGKQIGNNLFLDVHASYTYIQQEINFNSSTGLVDTLIAVQTADQNFEVSPVYIVAEREIKSRYGYAGTRLSATQYFWTTERRRFNITASAGMHYLVSANVREKINNQWVGLSTTNLNRLNYTFTASAGYNVRLASQWELMINPAITYFIRDVKSQDLPYRLSQRAVGLNFMLVKTLGKKN